MKKLFALAILILLFTSCNNRFKPNEIPENKQITDSLLLVNQYYDSLLNIVIDNFYKYRCEDSLFVGGINPYDVFPNDTLFIFNFEKGTIKRVRISDPLYDFDIEDLPEDATEYDKFLVKYVKNFGYINYIKGFPTDNEIIGDFNGDGKIDSLKLHDWIIDGDFGFVSDVIFSFSDKKIPKLKIGSNLDYTIKNEGDLDGDGADEIGFLYGWGTSVCRVYRVYTLKNNRWKIMAEIESKMNMRKTGILPIEKDPDQVDVLLIRESGFYECCQWASYVIERKVNVKDIVLQKIDGRIAQ
ncbi:MAG: VCBS repeat-containing protein [Lentimicrobiaceae bacterium]|nr:VCBS repeat-containing protein [Lentimicrobiaceae bacterium]